MNIHRKNSEKTRVAPMTDRMTPVARHDQESCFHDMRTTLTIANFRRRGVVSQFWSEVHGIHNPEPRQEHAAAQKHSLRQGLIANRGLPSAGHALCLTRRVRLLYVAPRGLL